jgi:hypothetical protein
LQICCACQGERWSRHETDEEKGEQIKSKYLKITSSDMNNSLLQTLMNLFTIFYLPAPKKKKNSAEEREEEEGKSKTVSCRRAFPLAEKLFVAIFLETYLCSPPPSSASAKEKRRKKKKPRED